MNETNFQLALIAAAKAEGKDPGRLTQREYQRLAMDIRSKERLVRDATKAIISRGMTGLSLRVVSEKKQAANKEICKKCPKFRILADSSPACDACSCSGKWLESKWADKIEQCPLGHWSNLEPEVRDEYA
jgi:hypothetical protein